MIIDVNAFWGHYPFRSLPFNSASGLLQLMDRNGIDRAVVTSLPAIFYRNTHHGNVELQRATAAHPQRLIPAATINPRYVGWQRELQECVEDWKMKAVTLIPSHHGYSLTDDYGHSALSAIEDAGVPVILTQRFEDRRQRHHWDVAEDLETGTLLEAARQHPRLKLMLSNWIGLDGPRLVDAGLKGRCLIDFARLHVVLLKDVPRLIAALGVEAIAFGSHMPFDYVGPSLVKIANLESLPAEDVQRIAWRNADSFFQLESIP